jgi:GGDEF domain-containing protein
VVPLRASVGVALARCDADTDPMTLVRQADAAMYIAKRTARATRDQLAAARALLATSTT